MVTNYKQMSEDIRQSYPQVSAHIIASKMGTVLSGYVPGKGNEILAVMAANLLGIGNVVNQELNGEQGTPTKIERIAIPGIAGGTFYVAGFAEDKLFAASVMAPESEARQIFDTLVERLTPKP